jgi:hypothetical protein
MLDLENLAGEGVVLHFYESAGYFYDARAANPGLFLLLGVVDYIIVAI